MVAEGRRWLPVNIGGEALLTIGRTVAFKDQGAALVVNCSPFGCMPGTTTAAIFRQMSVDLGLPIVSMFYDGTGNQNRRLEAFLHSATGGDRPAPRQMAADVPGRPLRHGEHPVRIFRRGDSPDAGGTGPDPMPG